MANGIKFDVSGFQRGLRAKLKATKRAESDVLNQAGGSVVANAIRLTKKASAGDIRSALQQGGLAFRLLQSPAMQSRLPKRLQGFTRGTHTRAQLDEAARQLVQARVASRAYIAAGWFKALAIFRPGSARAVSDKGLAGRGTARKASESRLVATFENFARGSGRVGAEALQQALNEEGRSMESYAARKLQQAWR